MLCFPNPFLSFSGYDLLDHLATLYQFLFPVSPIWLVPIPRDVPKLSVSYYVLAAKQDTALWAASYLKGLFQCFSCRSHWFDARIGVSGSWWTEWFWKGIFLRVPRFSVSIVIRWLLLIYYLSYGEGQWAYWKPLFTWELCIEVEQQVMEWILLAFLVNTVINVMFEVCVIVYVYVGVLWVITWAF